MERIEAHKLQPHFIESFFLEAFRSLGGTIRKRESGRYEITSVPFVIRNREMQIDFGEPVLQRYERICFEKDYCNIPGLVPASLIGPGHPLMAATVDLIREQNSDVMKRGAIFIDEQDYGKEPRVLFYIEDTIQDGKVLADGKRRVISKNIHFVEIKEKGSAMQAGYAPYLDYRAASEEELAKIHPFVQSQSWLTKNVEDLASDYAIASIIPDHFREVRTKRVTRVDKTIKAVKERLTSEIQYWDYRAADLKDKESAGKTNAKLNSNMAARRADELAARLQKRLSELEQEKNVTALPPGIIGGALIIPKGLLDTLTGKVIEIDLFGADRKVVEFAAMKAVMDIERELGFQPIDVSTQKVGYDVESTIPQEIRKGGTCLRFIEVKGRAKGASTVTITRNEILTAYNKPDEFILALVEVDGDQTKTVYLRRQFNNVLDFAVTSINYDMADLMNTAEIILQR